MHLGDEVRLGLDQDLVAPLVLGPAEVLVGETQQLQVRAHRAVEDDDALAQRLEVRRGGRIEPSKEFRGGWHLHQDTGASCGPLNGHR